MIIISIVPVNVGSRMSPVIYFYCLTGAGGRPRPLKGAAYYPSGSTGMMPGSKLTFKPRRDLHLAASQRLVTDSFSDLDKLGRRLSDQS